MAIQPGIVSVADEFNDWRDWFLDVSPYSADYTVRVDVRRVDREIR